MKLDLAVVMPVYNEEASVAFVIEEWVPYLDQLGVHYQIYVINDGSTDHTLDILKGLEQKYGEKLKIHSHSNRGHGQSCIVGYQIALKNNAQWILQIDSDGQCSPQYLPQFWESRSLARPAIFGYRYRRDDGCLRFLISRVVAIEAWVCFGQWVKDPNVPYRLMSKELLEETLPHIPSDFYLANILLSLLIRKLTPIYWLPIHFRDRYGGSPSVKPISFIKHGIRLLLHLLSLRFRIDS